MANATTKFHGNNYIRITSRRLEHLASLKLDLFNKTVLEPGAGIGDHSLFYLDRGCRVTAIEPRPENCAVLREHVDQFGSEISDRLRVIEGDASVMSQLTEQFDIVHCYGLLYHTSNPAEVIRMLAARCSIFVLLETCVAAKRDGINPVDEDRTVPTQAIDGHGCRPSRDWIFAELKRSMPYVFMPLSQPAHNQFPLDWNNPPAHGPTRAIFIASRLPLHNDLLIDHIPVRQTIA